MKYMERVCSVRKKFAKILWLVNVKLKKPKNPNPICIHLRYINHSGDPNAVYYDDFTVVALKDIEKGEELLHDYGWDKC